MGGYNGLPQLNTNPFDPLESYGKALSVKNLITQGQLGQQQLVGAQQENQQRAQQMKDQQTAMQIIAAHKGNMAEALPDLAGKVSPKTYAELQKGDAEARKAYMEMDEKRLAVAKQKNDQLYSIYQSAMEMPDQQYAQNWPAIAQQARAIDPTLKLDPAQPISKQELDAFGPFLAMHQHYADDALARKEAKAKAEGEDAGSQQKQLSSAAQQLANAPDQKSYAALFGNLPVRIAQNFPDPSKWSPDAKQQILQAGMTPHEQSTVPVDKIEMGSWLQQNPGKTPADYLRWKESGVTTTNDELGFRTSSSKSLPPVSGGSPKVSSGASPKVGAGAATTPGAPQTPAQRRESIVDEVGNYKMNPTLMTRMLNNHPGLISEVQQKYPDWDQTKYNLKNKAVMDLAPNGTTGKQVTSYNTFLRHAGDLYDAIDTLKNSGYQDWNKPMNWLAQHTGDPRVQAFMAKMQPVQKEFQSFLIGNHALYEDDRKDAKALFDENSSPEAMRAVLQSLAHTGGARLSETNNTFKRAAGRDIPNLVSPEAAAAYNKITGKGDGAKREMPKAGDRFVIEMNGKHYKYKGSGKTDDLSNYDEQ